MRRLRVHRRGPYVCIPDVAYEVTKGPGIESVDCMRRLRVRG